MRAHGEGVVLYTVGHSNRRLEEFLELLEDHGIALLVDIRRFPSSRRHPHFQAEALAVALARRGLDYLHLEPLGGRRRGLGPHSPNGGLRSPGLRAYADHMLTPEFREAVDRLLALAGARATAVMCAEAYYARCHRLLLADYLTSQGVEVRHILDRGRWEPHSFSPSARVTEAGVLYPALL